jgi:putative membrane protein
MSMLLIATILTAVVIAIHVYIVLIETVLFRTRGRKAFGLKEGQVDALAPLMSNQGCYNGFLAAMLALGLVHPDAQVGRAFVFFGLVCVAIAGVWGAATVSRRILFVQTVPAGLALVAWLTA